MSAQSFDFAIYELSNGAKIESDTETLEVGSIVSLVSEDGSKELAPEGPHTLEDGRTIVLDDSSKVTEIKEADAPTEEEVEAKKQEKMSMEMDPELVSSIAEVIKEKLSAVNEEDASNLANEILYLITVQDEITDDEGEEEDSDPTMESMKVKMQELSELVFQMAKNQQKFSATVEEKISKIPTGKAISEMEFKSTPEVIDPLTARIEALKNINK